MHGDRVARLHSGHDAVHGVVKLGDEMYMHTTNEVPHISCKRAPCATTYHSSEVVRIRWVVVQVQTYALTTLFFL